MSEITKAAEELREVIDSSGSFPKSEAKQFAVDRGVPEGQWGLVLGHGAGQNRKWWHEEDGMLVPGPKISANGGTPSVPKKDPLTLETPREQFVAVMTQLGIPTKVAEAVGYYIDSNYNINDPDTVAVGLKQVMEIMPAQKARLLTTWSSFLGVDITESLMRKAKELGAASPLGVSTNGKEPDEKAPRRFVAFKAQVLPVGSDDEGGMTFGEALQVANLQFGQMGSSNGDSGVMSTALEQMGENTRETMKLLSRDNGHSTPAPTNDNTELLLKFVEAKMDTERARNEGQVNLIVEQHAASMDKITEVLGQLAAGAQQKKSPFGDLDDIFPGLGKKLLDKILDPPETQAGGYKIKVPGLGGTDGADVELSLDAYERIKGMEQKDSMIALAKSQMPEFLRIGEKIAKSIDLAAKEEEQPDSQEQEAIGGVACPNPDCGIIVGFPVSHQTFQCPGCAAVINQEGQWLNEPVARQQPPASLNLDHEQLEEPAQEATPSEPPAEVAKVAAAEAPESTRVAEAPPDEPEPDEPATEAPESGEAVVEKKEEVPA